MGIRKLPRALNGFPRLRTAEFLLEFEERITKVSLKTSDPELPSLWREFFLLAKEDVRSLETTLRGRRRPRGRTDKEPQVKPPALDAWMYFLPKSIREAFCREWIEERDLHRAAGRSNLYIRATLWSQLLIMFVIGGRDHLLALARKLWAPAPE